MDSKTDQCFVTGLYETLSNFLIAIGAKIEKIDIKF